MNLLFITQNMVKYSVKISNLLFKKTGGGYNNECTHRKVRGRKGLKIIDPLLSFKNVLSKSLFYRLKECK